MKHYNSTLVKAIEDNGNVAYFGSLTACCRQYGIRYESSLKQLIETGGLAPDGRTFFDYPLEYEVEQIRKGKILLVDRKRRD